MCGVVVVAPFGGVCWCRCLLVVVLVFCVWALLSCWCVLVVGGVSSSCFSFVRVEKVKRGKAQRTGQECQRHARRSSPTTSTRALSWDNVSSGPGGPGQFLCRAPGLTGWPSSRSFPIHAVFTLSLHLLSQVVVTTVELFPHPLCLRGWEGGSSC